MRVIFGTLMLFGLATAAVAQHHPGMASPQGAGQAGFLVAVPDRGFMGNERVRRAFEQLTPKAEGELVFITDERSAPYLKAAVDKLRQRVERIVVLPLFLSRSESAYTQLQTLLSDVNLDLQSARLFGESYYAVEMLKERLASAEAEGKVVIAAYGAGDDNASTRAMAGDISGIAALASAGMDVQTEVLVWPETSGEDSPLEQAALDRAKQLAGSGQPLVSFHFGSELDSMMSFDSFLAYRLGEDVRIQRGGEDEIEIFSLWMQREANRILTGAGNVGVVFHAHGSDFIWNQAMRDAVAGIAEKYPLEFAFSMADPVTLRNAITRLEKHDVRGIILVRVFGLSSSFLPGIEQLLGEDVEKDVMPMHGGHDGHGMDMGHIGPVDRLRTGAMVVTVGGLEDHPLFAEALLDRANALSEDPPKETVILVAHGDGREETNRHWQQLLESLSSQMNALSNNAYRAIRFETWQEDWPDQREARIESVREMVREAGRDGGTAIIIPARTTGVGNAEKFLEGLDFRLGVGFAPHPLFEQWVESQIKLGLEKIRHSIRE